MKRNAFSMIELVFVIVVLGILAAVAVPKFAATRDDAQISKVRSDISSIRSAIVSERQTRLLRGQSNFINRLDAGVASDTENVKLFDSNETLTSTSPQLLSYGIVTHDSNGHWMKTAANTYTVKIINIAIDFTYYPNDVTVGGTFFRAGTFDCNHGITQCKSLTE